MSIHEKICEVCLNSDILCAKCQERFDVREIEEADLKVTKLLYELMEKFKILKEAKILKVVEGEYILIVARKGDAAKVIGKNGSIVKILSKRLNKQVKVIEVNEDIRRFVENIVFPATIEGVNILYTKEGGEVYRIRIPRTQAGKIDREMLKRAVESVFSRPVEILIV
jgi:transcription antitermination factor NusA-like protein